MISETTVPILLFNDECGVCRRIAKLVAKSATSSSGPVQLVERPIGADPVALRPLNGDLDIWDAYETIHLVMPVGSMKVGGEACAEVLRRLPRTKWLARSLSIDIGGFRPFLGCEGCGTPPLWLSPIVWTKKRMGAIFRERDGASRTRHFTRTPRPQRTG
jgi:hypothetical protein